MSSIFGILVTRRPSAGAVLCAAGLIAFQFAVSVGHAQQIGKQGWQSSPRNPSLASQYQFQRDLYGGSGSGLDALTQYITNYNTSSSSIGNYTEVNQALGDGANGTVTQSATQDSSGTQNADTASTDSFNSTVSGQNTTNAAKVQYATGN